MNVKQLKEMIFAEHASNLDQYNFLADRLREYEEKDLAEKHPGWRGKIEQYQRDAIFHEGGIESTYHLILKLDATTEFFDYYRKRKNKYKKEV